MDQSGRVNLTDAVHVLGYLFLGHASPLCLDAADINDDGAVNITDPLYLLQFLFLGNAPPPPPYPDCGVDPTSDQFECFSYSTQACRNLPKIRTVVAPSNHYVSIDFQGPLEGGSLETLRAKSAYSIRAPDDSELEILEVRLDLDDGRRVLLATASQRVVAYTLTVSGVEGPDAPGEGGGGAGGSIVFQGSDDAEPRPISAISLGSTEVEGKVLLTYSEPMDEGLLDVRFYVISDPDLKIRRVDLSAIGVLGTTVVLTTEPQRNLPYSLKVTNVKSKAGAFVVDPTRNVVTFQGVPAVDTTPPTVLKAEPTNNRTIVLTFSEPLRPGSEDPRNFVIRCFDPFTNSACPNLVIEGSELTTLGTQIVLTTLPQAPGVQYTVEILNRCGSLPDRDNCVKDIQENPISPTGNKVTFTGLDRDRPYLASAISLGPDALDPTRAHVLLTFSEPVLAGAQNIAFYSITQPALDIFAAALSLDGLTVSLTTSAQDPVEYTVKATNIISRAGGYALDPTRSSAPFVGIPPVDTIRPRVTAAVSTSLTSVAVAFSEPILPGAADGLNFRITCRDPVSNSACPDLIVTGATLANFGTQISLNTLPQTADVEYTVTVLDRCAEAKDACVKDLQGNRIDPAANTATFVFDGNPLLSEQRPRVVGAASTSNTTVVVTFSKTMDRSVENASSYVIVQVNVNPEVGFLAVISARFLDADHTSVELTTLSQNEVTYSVTAVNVRDLAGNQLEPPLIVHGVGLVSAGTAEFPGTPPAEGQIVDTDTDGVADNIEQRGYVVTITLTDGSVVQRQVTSSPSSADTDLDGLDDATERQIGTDPRTHDTDGDRLDDNLEFNVIFSSPNNQDTDSDGIDDNLEVEYFRTNANVADSDGDGFTDDQELFVMHRDPRIADLPNPGIGVDSLNLLLQESFSFTNESGDTQEATSSTTANVSSSSTQTVSTTFGAELGFNVSGKFEGGNEGLTDPTLVPEPIALSEVEVGLNFGLSFQVSRESSQTMSESFDVSLSKGRTVTNSLSSTREVTGGRVDALVRLNNLSDVAFSLTNLEITVSAPDPVNRTKFIPIATLIPNSELVTGEAATFNLGVFGRGLGPILFSSRDVFPTLVEDLLRDPRGLLFEIANFDVTDEFGRNFAFASQMARDRTVALSIDFGDGKPEQFLVAVAPVRNNRGEIVGGYGDFAGTGPLPGLPLEFILEQSLDLRRSKVQVPAVWTAAANQRPLVETAQECAGGDRDGEACDDNADCPGGACTAVVVPADGILVGANGVSDSIAQGDDVQQIPFGIDGLPPEAVVISAGEDGVLDSGVRGDDVPAVVTGYATTSTCGPDTPSSIRPGPNGIVDTLRDPFSDDVQVVFPGLGAALTTDIILPGPNGFIDTAAAGDDVFVGPGVPCSLDSDCPGAGACDGQEALFRFKRRERGQFGRAWAVLLTDSSQLGVDFRKIQVRPGNHVSLSFIQDLDRDGLISDVEFIFGSSDTRQDTDGDGLDDFSEIRVGWEVGVEGSPLRRVFPDPRFRDSDGDGLSDLEEQDIRRVQCECDGGDNAGQSCTNILAEECPDASCVNVADRDANGNPTACSSLITSNRLDPRRRDTDDDLVSDADETLGWLTQAAILDPVNVVVAGPNRTAESLACPDHVCLGGANNGSPCRFDRDCPTLRRCQGGVNDLDPCANDIECQGPTAATSGLCEEDEDEVGVCNRPILPTPCDDVQVIAPGTFAGNKNAVVIAPGPNGQLESALRGDDIIVGSAARPGDRRGSTTALADDQQIRLPGECLRDDDLDGLCDGVCEDDPGVACEQDSDCGTRCISAPLERIIIRPGVNGIVDTLPNNSNPLGDDVRARGQYLQTTNPLAPDTDRDQINEGFERILGSDPRNAVDGGLLVDKDGDGLTDGQEEFVGWIVRATTPGGLVVRRVFSNPNTPDTDLDFLPDYVEHALGTDPTSQDTDGDGLSDFDELSSAQLTDFTRFNDFFPGYFIDGSLSMAYGTNPLSIDTDGDTLTDDFELQVGWNVTVPTERGQEVRHVLTDPANPDTDFDGLNDNLERTHTVDGLAAPSSDPTDFDSDDDGRTDGNECPTSMCQTDPLVPDKKVTVRFVQMTIERGSADGALDLVDISYALGAKRSDQPYLPSQQRFVTGDPDDCPGDFYTLCNPPQCQVKEGKEIVFNSAADRVGGVLTNEKVFALKPRQGLLLNGVIDQWEGCPFSTLHVKGRCTNVATGEEFAGCCDTDGSTDCPAGQTCLLSSFEPRTCQGCGVVGVNGRPCRGDGDCIVALGPLTCGRCLGVPCPGGPGGPCTLNPADGTLSLECRPSTTTGPTGHLSYLKSLSYETLQDGFSTDIVTLNDQGAGGSSQGFGVTLTVEIIVD